MITLGIAKMNFGKCKEPELPPAVLQAVSEAAVWCSRRAVHSDQLRSPELDASTILDIPTWDEKLGIEDWIQAKHDSYRRAVSTINHARSTLLCNANIAVSEKAKVQSKGKLLRYEPLETVRDGASEAGSRGFFHIQDAPPWDTWFHYANEAIFSWIPESLILDAQAGIDCNPVDCIHWATWSELFRNS